MKKISKIACIGAGYVGGPTMSVIAYKNPDIEITVVDVNADRINAWNSSDFDKLPIFEPGLNDIVRKTRGKNLFFSSDIDKAIEEADLIFISVNTPTKTYGKGKGQAADLKYVESCARHIARVAKNDKIVVEKSTIPVKTAQAIKNILDHADTGVKFHVLSNPEFLAEGSAVKDLKEPDRVLIGGDDDDAIEVLSSLYTSWIPEDRIITTNIWSSELSKLVSNAFLAQRISSINAISELCEATGADVTEVARAVGMDSRIGGKYLNASVGFGGSCFKKDILNLVYIARTYNLNEVADYWEQVLLINEHQKERFASQIIKALNNTVSGKKVALLGWAFKKDTNDSRESAAIHITDLLLEEQGEVWVFDPKVSKERILQDINDLGTRSVEENGKLIHVVNTPQDAIDDSHALIILTEWDEFKEYDYSRFFESMFKPAFLFDGRNILDRKLMEEIGFNYFGIGR